MKSTPRPLPEDLHTAQSDIHRWRKANDRRRRIPESFWRQAVTLARAHGVNRVAVAMRLSHARIASRAQRDDASTSLVGGKNQQVHFVELARPVAMPETSAAIGLALELADGSSRRLRVTGTDAHSAAHIITTFFGIGAAS